jgi:hypothetical protein
MSEHTSVTGTPRAEFADRLEADLLHVLAGGGGPRSTERETTVELEPRPHDPPRSRWRGPILAAAAIVAVACGGVALRALRDDGGSSTASVPMQPATFSVTWDYTEQVNHCLAAGRACLNGFGMPATAELGGTIEGSANQSVVWNAPADYTDADVDHLEHVAVYNVSGTVEGCGSGELMIVEIMQFVSGAGHDREDGTYTGTWQIVPESGRVELTGVSGSGASNGLFATAGDVGREFTGTISCG